MLPTIHFYMSGFGRINRFVLKPSNAAPLLTRQITRFVGDDSPIELLRQLERGGRDAVVRYADLVEALKAMNSAPEMLSEQLDEDSPRYQSIVNDERKLRDLELLFQWLDKDSSQSLDADEIAAATAALRPGATPSEEEVEASQALLDRIAAASGADEPTTGSASLDFAGFVRIMAGYQFNNFASPDELLPAFSALDADQGGTITVDELLGAVKNMCEALPTPGPEQVCVEPALIEQTFAAFDLDSSGAIDYEEFVSMVTGRGESSPYDYEPPSPAVTSWYDAGTRLK